MMILVLGACDELAVEARPGALAVTIISDTSGMVGTTTFVDLLVELDGVDLTGVPVRWEPIDSTAISVLAGANSAALMNAESIDTLDATLFAEVTFLRRGTHDLLVHVDSVGFDALQAFPLTFIVEERWQSVSAGPKHTCAVTYGDTLDLGLREGGEIFCWGSSDWGQLGNGFDDQSDIPLRVASDVVFDEVRVGGGVLGFSCARQRIGLLHCWGDNVYGQLGLGNRLDQFVPRLIALGEGLGEFDVGGTFACAERGREFGVTICWGNNQLGQLGCGTINTCDTILTQPDTGFEPTFVVRPDSTNPIFSSLGVGERHVCGLEGVDVLCWGSNFFGQLGVPAATFTSRSAIPIQGGLGFVSLAAGGNNEGGFTCGLDENLLEPYCWGQMGEFGSMTSTPIAVSGLPAGPFTALTAGGAHACALGPDGAAYCWGESDDGQLGDGTTNSSDMAAVPVVQPVVEDQQVGFVIMSAGTRHTCAITDQALKLGGNVPNVDPPGSGAIYCWGSDERGQLGNGDVDDSSVPMRVVEPAP